MSITFPCLVVMVKAPFALAAIRPTWTPAFLRCPGTTARTIIPCPKRMLRASFLGPTARKSESIDLAQLAILAAVSLYQPGTDVLPEEACRRRRAYIRRIQPVALRDAALSTVLLSTPSSAGLDR